MRIGTSTREEVFIGQVFTQVAKLQRCQCRGVVLGEVRVSKVRRDVLQWGVFEEECHGGEVYIGCYP